MNRASIISTDRHDQRGPGRWLALAALGLSGLVLGLDITVLVTALPTLSAKLGASTSDLQWILDAYTLALAGLLLPAGVIADRYGRKRLLLAGLVLFGFSSIAASQMTSASGLIWMRALMGAGAAVIMPLLLAILPTIFSEEERPRALALVGAGTFLGLPLGPLVAGWLLDHFDWGSVFLINGPVVVLALLGVWFFIPESRDLRARPLDWLGGILSVVGVTSLVFGIIEEPVHGWTDSRVLAGLIGGAVVLGAFVAWEFRVRSPLIDLRLFTRPRFAFATLAFVVVGLAMTGVLFILAPYLQIVEGNSAQATGIRLLPLIAAVMVGALGSDRVTVRLGSKVSVAGGLLVAASGLVVLSRATAESGYGLVAAAMVLLGIGLGSAMIPALDAILGALPEGEVASGNALTRALQNVAASFGVAVLGSILNTAYRSELTGHLAGLPTAVVNVAQGSLAGAAAVASRVPGPTGVSLFRAAEDAYAHGMSEVMLASAAITIAGAVLIAVFLPARATHSADQAQEEGSQAAAANAR